MNNPNKKSLEKYLLENIEKDITWHTLVARKVSNGQIVFYIHPSNKNGDTLDFVVNSNQLSNDTLPDIENCTCSGLSCDCPIHAKDKIKK